jgi:hypothetical protein
LTNCRILKCRKKKYSFTSLGESQLNLNTISKHKKIEGREKVKEPSSTFTRFWERISTNC